MEADMKIYIMLRASSLFQEFPDEELTELLPRLHPELRRYSRGAVIADSNTLADKMGIVESGEVASQRATFSGNMYVSTVYKPGELFGINAFGSSPGTWPMSFVTTMESSILTFSMRPFMTGNTDPETLRRTLYIWRSIGHNGADRQNKEAIREISRSASTVRGKILTFFDLMQDKYGSNTFKLRMTREQLVGFLNVGRSSMYRELSLLQQEGIIAIDGRNMVAVNNDKLEENI